MGAETYQQMSYFNPSVFSPCCLRINLRLVLTRLAGCK